MTVRSKGETTWCVFEHHPVLSRANVQGVIDRWSRTWSEAVRHRSISKVRAAWRIGLKLLVVRLRSNAARAFQNLRKSNLDEVWFFVLTNLSVLRQLGRFLFLSSHVCSFLVASPQTCKCVSDLPFLLLLLVVF